MDYPLFRDSYVARNGNGPDQAALSQMTDALVATEYNKQRVYLREARVGELAAVGFKSATTLIASINETANAALPTDPTQQQIDLREAAMRVSMIYNGLYREATINFADSSESGAIYGALQAMQSANLMSANDVSETMAIGQEMTTWGIRDRFLGSAREVGEQHVRNLRDRYPETARQGR